VPTKEEIAATRKAAGLTQEQAAALVHRKRLAWYRWESGRDPIDMACWELFLLKTKSARKSAK
jgi:DNA-binding XRE family transcriptional regulator